MIVDAVFQSRVWSSKFCFGYVYVIGDYLLCSCAQVKCLRLLHCPSVTDKGFSEAAAKLPLLEELDLTNCSISERALEAVGRHFLHLKSLKLYRKLIFRRIENNEEAHTIAKTMPELRRLQLFGNKLTNEGLKVILDGCPHLEFLDLRGCFNVNLSGELGKRCAEQVKDLRPPVDWIKYDGDSENSDEERL